MRTALLEGIMVVMLTVLLGQPMTVGAQNPAAQKLMEQGLGHLEKRQLDQAIASFQKAIGLEPNSALLYNYLGMAYRFQYLQVRHQDLKQREITAFEKAIQLDPHFWVALINLGVTYYGLGEKAKAAPLLQKALTLNPQHPEKAQLEKMIQEGKATP